jgi:uncharacterized protein (TIGR03086 family)
MLIDSIDPSSWTSASPCEGWTALDVVRHVVTTEADFLRQRDLLVPEIDAADPVAAWPGVRDAIAAVLADDALAGRVFDGYFGPTTIGETLERFYVADLLVHRWDLAMAVGSADHAVLDDDERDFLAAAVGTYPPEVMRMPGIFGPEVSPPEGADPTTRLMAYLGRSS